MAFAKVTYTGNGVTTNFTVTFPYLVQDHVKVYVDGVLKTLTTDYTWSNSTTIQFNVAPANATAITIQRSSNQAARLVDYQDGSTLTEALMDADALQNFYVAQESFDKADDAFAAAAGVTVPVLPITNGGTGSDTAVGARNSLGITPSNIGAVATSDIGVSVQGYDVETAKLNVGQAWSAPQRATVSTVSTLTLDLTSAQDFLIQGTFGSGTLTFTGKAAGRHGTIFLSNAPAYSISKPADTYTSSNFLSTISASGVYVISYWCLDDTSVVLTVSSALSTS